jgi:prepilin-type N-terminal cleavage/methylation domain-containing protein
MRNRPGFTLIELMIITVLIGLLATIAVTKLNGFRDKAKLAATRSELRNVITAAEVYRTVHGYFPATLDDLVDGGFHREPTNVAYCTFSVQPGPPEDLHLEAAYEGSTRHLVAQYPSWGVNVQETTAATDCG